MLLEHQNDEFALGSVRVNVRGERDKSAIHSQCLLAGAQMCPFLKVYIVNH